MEGIANRIERLRNESGKSELEVADILCLSIYEYEDLESYDDEITDVISLKTAKALAAIYNA
jgi:transcriptional regulator with XRE-family HTH domain